MQTFARIDRLKPDERQIAELDRLTADGVRQNVSLAEISRWRIGGLAPVIVLPADGVQLAAVVASLRGEGLPYVLFGASSNLLFSDEGLDVVAIQIGSRMAGIERQGCDFIVQAGAWVPRVAATVARAGFTGIEHVCGIPGTMGGLVFMNGGSLRHSIGEHVAGVTSVDRHGRTVVHAGSECGFGYRHSRFHENGEIVARVRLSFSETNTPSAIRRRMLKIMADRKTKFPVKMPNCGSVFKAHDEMYRTDGPPGAVLDRLGFKGRQIGGAQVALQHANFINNLGGATADDVRGLARRMRTAVREATGYTIEPEARYVQPDGSIVALV